MRLAGYDPSLTSFGGARVSSDQNVWPELYVWDPGKRRGDVRLQWFLDRVEETALTCDLALVEGIVGGGVAGVEQHLRLAELHGLVKHRLWQMDIPYVVVTPSSRMKYITGKGMVKKEECLLAVERRFPHVGVKGTDDADAFSLAAMGADYYGFPLAKMPEAQRAVLTAIVPAKKRVPAHPAIVWPELRKAA